MIQNKSSWRSLTRLFSFFVFAFALSLPILFWLGIILRWGVNVPLTDQWVTTAPMIVKFFNGRLNWAELAASYNGHRILFPRLVTLALAAFTRWNVRYEMYANWVILLLAWLLTTHLLRLTAPRPGWIRKPLIIVFALLIFNLTPGYNILYGFNLAWNLANGFAVWGVWACVHWAGKWRGLVIAMFASIGAMYSLGSGPALWLVLLAGFVVQWKRWRWTQIIAFFCVLVLTFALYLNGYETKFAVEAIRPDPFFIFQQPLVFVQFVCTLLGAIFGAYGGLNLALGYGILGLLTLGGALFYLWRDRMTRLTDLVPWLQLVLFGLGTASLIAVGRVERGIENTLANQYFAGTLWFWVGVFALCGFAARAGFARHRIRPLAGFAFAIIILLFVWGFGNATRAAFDSLYWANLSNRIGLQAVYNYATASDAELVMLFDRTDFIRTQVKRLETNRLGPFATGTGEEIAARFQLEWEQKLSELNLAPRRLTENYVFVAPPTARDPNAPLDEILDFRVTDPDGAHFFVNGEPLWATLPGANPPTRFLEIQSARASSLVVQWQLNHQEQIVRLTPDLRLNDWKVFRVPFPENARDFAFALHYLEPLPLSDSLRIVIYESNK